MFKKTVLALLLAGTSFSSFANWVGGVSYFNLSDDISGSDISLGGISGSLGYKIDSGNNLNFIPEVRIGTGINDDTLFGIDVELDSFIALSVRGQYSLENGVYLFAAPSYANAKLTATYNGFSESDDSWEFGIGGGAGYKFNETISAEFMYEQFDGTDVLSFGIKFDF